MLRILEIWKFGSLAFKLMSFTSFSTNVSLFGRLI